MIETNKVGQKQLEELVDHLECCNWSEWEFEFIADLDGKEYSTLSVKMKAKITELYEKL